MSHMLKREPTDARHRAEASDLRAIFFLRRIGRLAELRQSASRRGDAELLRLVDHATFSTYLDLREMGWKQEAQELLESNPPRR